MQQSSEPVASQADIDADKKSIQKVIAILNDETKSQDDRQTAWTTMIKNLHEPYKQRYDAVMEEFRIATNSLPSPAARKAAQQLLQNWESGASYGPKDQVEEEKKRILGPLTEAEREEYHTMQKKYNEKFMEALKDVMPTIEEEKKH